MKREFFGRVLLLLLFAASGLSCQTKPDKEEIFESLLVDAGETNIEFFWQDDKGETLRSIGNLKAFVEKSGDGRRLRFAMNGGMYQTDNKPLGLYIENQKTIAPLNTRNGTGNFYLKPNGVFYITTDNKAFVVATEDFRDDGPVKFATQSGPMLVADGSINPEFKADSANLNLRNGVCVRNDGKIIFAISRREVNFYEFAVYFQKSGCRNALYLDGYVSRMYLPEKNYHDLDGDFGVIIGIRE